MLTSNLMGVTCTATLLETARARRDIKDHNLRILEALHDGGNDMTASELAATVGRSPSAVWRSLSVLLRQGLVAQREQVRPGKRPLVYYRMADPLDSLMAGEAQVPAILSPVEQLITTLAESRGMAPEELVVRALKNFLNNGDPSDDDRDTRRTRPVPAAA